MAAGVPRWQSHWCDTLLRIFLLVDGWCEWGPKPGNHWNLCAEAFDGVGPPDQKTLHRTLIESGTMCVCVCLCVLTGPFRKQWISWRPEHKNLWDFYSFLIFGTSHFSLVGSLLNRFKPSLFGRLPTRDTGRSSQSELFPSKIRVSALSISGTCGRFGALLAPAIIEEWWMSIESLVWLGKSGKWKETYKELFFGLFTRHVLSPHIHNYMKLCFLLRWSVMPWGDPRRTK